MNKEILRLAVPNILSNISVPLLSTVDTALMGQFSYLHIGAVGIGTMIFNIIYWNFGFLRMGTTGITAQAYGRKDGEDIVLTFARAMAVAIVIGLLLLALQNGICAISLRGMDVQDNQIAMVTEYFSIRIWAAPASLGLYAILGWYFGMQNAIFPLIITIAVNLVNIGLNFLFIYTFGMDVAGVAWGTVCAQYFGLLLGIILFFGKYRSYLSFFSVQGFKVLSAFKRFLVINRDIFIRTVFMTIAYAFFYSWSSKSGDMILAINVILLQFVFWMSYGIDGFAFAAESLVGKYAGIGDPAQLKKAIRLTLVWGFATSLLFSAIYGIFGRPVFYIFTDDTALIQNAMPYFIWIVILPLAAFVSFIWDGIFIGLTAAKAMRNTMAFALVIFFITLYFSYPKWLNHGLWLALFVFMIARGLAQWWLYYRMRIGS